MLDTLLDGDCEEQYHNWTSFTEVERFRVEGIEIFTLVSLWMYCPNNTLL